MRQGGKWRHYREKSGTLLIDLKPVRDDEESTGWTQRQPPLELQMENCA